METSKKRKILIVANVAKEHILKFHIPTIKKLKDEGWIVDVACSGKEKIPFCNNQYMMSYKRSPFSLKTFKGIKELKKIIDKENYDLVYCHTPVGGLVARLASVNARKKETKVIYMAHGYHFFRGAPILNWCIYYPVEKILSKFTDAIILINKEDYEITKNKFKNKNTYLIDGIGIDIDKFKNKNSEEKEKIKYSYREALNIPQDATVLIYLAELIPNKNQKLLMDMLKITLEKYSNVYLVFAGIDHCNGKLQEYAYKIGVYQNIRFLGWRDDIYNLYAMADICTASSIREGFGLNLVEAMACCVPVIATQNRGHSTIIEDGENGYLIPLNNPEYFSDKVIELIKNNNIVKMFISNSNRNINKYKSDVIVENIYKIFSIEMK